MRAIRGGTAFARDRLCEIVNSGCRAKVLKQSLFYR